jgi:CHAT domain-containing protein
MTSDRPVLVLGCQNGHIDAGFLPGDLRWGNAHSIRDLLPPSLAWLYRPGGPWFFFLDGALHHLPIEWLPEGGDAAEWFGKDRGIQICLRSSVHPATRRRVDFSRGWLGLGDVPGRGKLPDLPDTRREITEIRSFLEDRDCLADALLGEQANAVSLRERLTALRPAVLHFATHGCFDREYPDACCLFLAETPGAPEREMLPFRRVQELDLQGVDLVVLSACHGSKGRSSRAAGFEGLAWAFLQAGAAQVVASRYPVGERSTADLMRIFYRHLQDLPAAEALGRTRTECLAEGMEASEVGAWSVLS